MALYYQQYGTSGPPLIILHGLLGASGNWHTLSRDVFSEAFRVFAVDQRNHGRSPHADRFDYDAMAGDVIDFMDQHELETAHLLGHSMGGKTAMQAALTAPGRVDRLVVADMAPKAYPPHHTPILEALAALDPTQYDSRSTIDDALAEAVASWPVRQFLLKNLNYDGTRYRWQMNLDAIRANYDAVVDAIDVDATFGGPARFIAGGRSDYVAEDDLPRIRTQFPQAELVTIDDAGHWVHADAPEAFADAVMTFLTAPVPSP